MQGKKQLLLKRYVILRVRQISCWSLLYVTD